MVKPFPLSKTNNFTNGVFGNDTNPLYANTKAHGQEPDH